MTFGYFQRVDFLDPLLTSPMQPQPILHFWFEELSPKRHFVKDAALDETIRARFGDTLEAAARCEFFAQAR